MLRLAEVLARQGHELIVWAPEEWRPAVEDLQARFEPSVSEIPRVPSPVLAAELAALTEREAELLIAQLHSHDVELVIRDSQTPWALVAAKYLGIPHLVSHPMFPMFGSGPGGYAQDRIGEQLNPEARERFERSWLSIARRWGVELDDVRGLYHQTGEPTLVFTTEQIIGDRELPPSWRCIGPLLPPPAPARSEDGRPLVYACFGTAQNRRTELFRLVIAALAHEPVRLVISAGGRRLTGEDLGPLPDNVVIHEFAESREVLARASVHITHGGCNSVHESLLAGVPMVCLPQAFDQIPLSGRIAELGVGAIADEHPDKVARAVLTLLDDGQARVRISEISERLQRYDGESRVASAVAVRP